MLDITLFDTTSYDEILKKMRKELEKKSGTHFYDSDMEVVILELWALLIDMQNYTMDVTSEQMKKEMLRFLLGDIKKCKQAKGVLFAKPTHHQWILTNTLFDRVANLPFEVVETTFVQANVIQKRCAIMNDVKTIFQKDLIVKKGMQIELSLSAPMQVHRPFSLYFEILKKRVQSEHAYRQGRLTCYYETIHGPCILDVEDETHVFLTSGRIMLYPRKQHCESFEKKGYRIWFVIDDEYYDEAACIHDIRLNPIPIQQQITYAKSLYLKVQHRLQLQEALAIEGCVSVFVYRNGCYHVVPYVKEVDKDTLYLCLDKELKGDHLLIILSRDSQESAILGSTNGISMQRISTTFLDIHTMKLLMKQEDGWHEVDTYPYHTYQKARYYGAWYHATQGWVQFGCGKDFLIPQKGRDNILYRDLVISRGKKGNIKEQILTSPTFEQPFPIQDGEDEETLEEAYQRVNILMQKHPAITSDDIEALARQFPGNALTYVKCIPKKYLFNNGEKGYVVMLAASQPLKDKYMETIRGWLKKQGPLGMELDVMQAEALPISIEICAHFYAYDKDMIKTCIQQWLMSRQVGEIVKSATLINHICSKAAIKDITDCRFYIKEQFVEQFQIPYHMYVVVEKLKLILNE